MEDNSASEKGFNARIFQCIERALSTLGETAKVALIHQIASQYNLRPDEIHARPLEFIEHLHEILGDAGYSFIEKLIKREVKTEFHLTLEEAAPLQQVIAEARKQFLS